MVLGRVAGFGVCLWSIRQHARPSVDVVGVRLKRVVILAVRKTLTGDKIAVV